MYVRWAVGVPVNLSQGFKLLGVRRNPNLGIRQSVLRVLPYGLGLREGVYRAEMRTQRRLLRSAKNNRVYLPESGILHVPDTLDKAASCIHIRVKCSRRSQCCWLSRLWRSQFRRQISKPLKVFNQACQSSSLKLNKTSKRRKMFLESSLQLRTWV